MAYLSTRGLAPQVPASAAILNGLAPDGGLYLPVHLPRWTAAHFEALKDKSYQSLATAVFQSYLDDYSKDEIEGLVEAAYGAQFDRASITSLIPHGKHQLQALWHGPTQAFKDMALQALPGLYRLARKKQADSKAAIMVAATSGDTGSAALEGFAQEGSLPVLVLYPHEGPSAIQLAQMRQDRGPKFRAYQIAGNFDQAQAAVKALYAQKPWYRLSSANSINWGRLLPQIVYHVQGYLWRLQQGQREPYNVVVPSGNFGNIFAGYLAQSLGVPIRKLVCASNQNRVLTDFIQHGQYQVPPKLFVSSSPSMDILRSSNVERLVFELVDRDAAALRARMDALDTSGSYRLPEAAFQKLQRHFTAESASEAEVLEQIHQSFKEEGVLLDPHSAVGMACLKKLEARGVLTGPAMVMGTASPFKFPKTCLKALKHPQDALPAFEALRVLEEITGHEAPQALKAYETAAQAPVLQMQAQDLGQAALALLRDQV